MKFEAKILNQMPITATPREAVIKQYYTQPADYRLGVPTYVGRYTDPLRTYSGRAFGELLELTEAGVLTAHHYVEASITGRSYIGFKLA